MMTLRRFAFALLCAAPMMLLADPSHADDDSPALLPEVGSEVVIYTHTFQPQYFDEGVELITHGFADAIEAVGQKRTNVILVHPSTFEVVNVSFFDSSDAVKAWHSHEARLDVLRQLEPLMTKPIDIKVLTAAAIYQSAKSD